MTDEVLRNGVPHQVTTSLVTHNAVLPQNILLAREATARQDSDVDEGSNSALNQENSSGFDQPSSAQAPQDPTSRDTLVSNKELTILKSHIRDNIQALKNLAHSDNWQSLGNAEKIDEHKLYLEKKSINSHRQSIFNAPPKRSEPSLANQNVLDSIDLVSGEPVTPTSDVQASDTSSQGKRTPAEDNAFQIRIRKLKSHLRDVDNTLQDLAPDK